MLLNFELDINYQVDTFSPSGSRPLRVMAIPAVVGPRTLTESLKLGSSDLRFTLSRNDVPDDMQAHFFENGVTSVSKFSSFFAMKQILSMC